MAINDVRISVTANITVTDEMAERCLRLLEIWQDDNADKKIVGEKFSDGRTVFRIVTSKGFADEAVDDITPEMVEAAERNEKRIKERADRIYDEMIAENRAEIERLEAEIAKMPPFDAEKLAADPIAPPKEFII